VGSWGTALGLLLARNGHAVHLWGHDPNEVALLDQDRQNRRYLPDIPFPPALSAGSSLDRAVDGAKLVLAAVPSHAYGATLLKLRPLLPTRVGFAWATKGLEHESGRFLHQEHESGRFLHQVTEEILGAERSAAVISGPSFAREVALGLPTAVTVAAREMACARRVAGLYQHRCDWRRTGRSGQERIGDCRRHRRRLGLWSQRARGGFGANARAALITRGLAELVRLGLAVGGRRETFMGLAGIGDLVLTCTDDQSRNRRFGLAIGRGETAQAAFAAIGQVVEGAATAREIVRLAELHRVEMPIAEQVDRVLHQGKNPRQAVESLLARDPKPETL